MKLKIAGVLVGLILPLFLNAQQPRQKVSYDDLIRQIDLHQGTPKVWTYLKLYRDKAGAEKNYMELVGAYREMLHESAAQDNLAYADSMVFAAERSGVADLVGSSYLSKGIVYFQRREHQKALDNYVIANKHLVAGEDPYLRHKVKYSMAQIKYYLGYYNEAISLFRECITYFRDEEPLPYLKSLHSLALCYAAVDSLQLADNTNALTLDESARLGIKDMLPYIDNTSGIILYKSSRYGEAIEAINSALPRIRENEDFANEAVAHLHLGKSYWQLGKQELAMRHFKAIDTIFRDMKYMRPDLRESYEYLIKYYHREKMPNIELHYIDQLLMADSILSRDFRYLVKKIHKEYDTAELLAEKEKIHNELKHSKWHGFIYKGAAALLAIVLGFTVWRHTKLKKIYRQRFEELINKGAAQPPVKEKPVAEVLDINPDIVAHIIAKLDEFESKKGYLKKDLTAVRLAENFRTNYKYLSRVVRFERGKSFVNYINDLRIDYIVQRLKAEPLLRRYTNGALAEEAGFSTAQHFVTAFKKRAGMPPGYFLENLDKMKSQTLN